MAACCRRSGQSLAPPTQGRWGLLDGTKTGLGNRFLDARFLAAHTPCAVRVPIDKIRGPADTYHGGLPMANTYTAITKQDGDWWIGWIEEVPGVNCQERSREELRESLRVTLARGPGVQPGRGDSSGNSRLHRGTADRMSGERPWSSLSPSSFVGQPTIRFRLTATTCGGRGVPRSVPRSVLPFTLWPFCALWPVLMPTDTVICRPGLWSFRYLASVGCFGHWRFVGWFRGSSSSVRTKIWRLSGKSPPTSSWCGVPLEIPISVGRRSSKLYARLQVSCFTV